MKMRIVSFIPEAVSLEPQDQSVPAAAVKTGWQLIDDGWYYFNPNHDGT